MKDAFGQWRKTFTVFFKHETSVFPQKTQVLGPFLSTTRCERGDSRAQQLRPSFLARSAVLGVQSTKGGQVKRGCSVGKAEGMLRLQES